MEVHIQNIIYKCTLHNLSAVCHHLKNPSTEMMMSKIKWYNNCLRIFHFINTICYSSQNHIFALVVHFYQECLDL